MKWKLLSDAIWKLAYDEKRPIRSFFYKVLRIFYFSIHSFFHNECYLKASLLTFYSLISIVPLLAIIFAVAKGFGFEDYLQKQILATFKEQQDVLSNAMRFAYAFIGHIKSQTIVGVGVLFLFFSVFGLFENIEKSLNAIWSIRKHRSLMRRLVNYLTAVIIIPVIFIASTGITVFLNTEILKTGQTYEILKHFSEYLLDVIQFVPYALMCILFSFLYIFTPNAKIHFKPRIFAGILAGAIFQFWQIIYIDFQVFISSYNVIYGSFAALPLFLIWMQINFVIFLYGAEVAAQIENDRFFRKSLSTDRFKAITNKQLILLVLHDIAAHFLKGEGPLSIDHISEHLGIPLFDTRRALNVLESEGLITEITFKRGSLECYQLIINPELFTVQDVSRMIDENLLKFTRSKETSSLQVVSSCLDNFEKSIQESGSNFNLKDFASLPPNEKP